MGRETAIEPGDALPHSSHRVLHRGVVVSGRTSDWSQEIRLTYESDAFDAILGGYYFNQTDNTFGIRDVPDNAVALATANLTARRAAICAANPLCFTTAPFFAVAVPNPRDENLLDIENAALFGAVEWHITPEINLGVEGRYAEEKVRQLSYDFDEGQPRPLPIRAQETFKKFTPRVTFDWKFTPDNMLYAIYAEGQKPGGFNGPLAIAAGVPSFEAENNRSYELGLKNRLFGGRAIFNVAAFFTEISGYQLTQNVSVPPNQVSVVVNAGDAEIWGLEAELLAELAPGLSLTANYALANAEFTSGFDESQGVLNDVADDGLVNCSTGDQFPDIAGCQSLFGSIEGKTIPRAPKHRFFADIDFRTPIGAGGWEVFAGANVTYTSTSFAQVHNLAETGDSTVVDARVGVQNDRYKVQFYVKNLFDEDAVSQILRYADGNNDLRRNFVAGLRPGRRFGVVVSAGF
ncbi:TonB-dependent receptor [Leptolyngbya sp. 15MV]|nr:TonB-dependent receptor [Leptolyngbya sp. 15MV]